VLPLTIDGNNVFFRHFTFVLVKVPRVRLLGLLSQSLEEVMMGCWVCYHVLRFFFSEQVLFFLLS